MSTKDKEPRVLILGFGALGALYGFLLSRGGAKVFAVARSNADSLLQRGIDIDSQKYGKHLAFKPDGVFRTAKECRDEAEQRPFDYILTTVKICPEQRRTGEWVREYLPKLTAETSRKHLPTIVFVQNGIGIEEEPYETLCGGDENKDDSAINHKDVRAGTMISCCAWLGATLTKGGTCVEHGPLESLEMGLYPFRENGESVEAPAAWRQDALNRFAQTYASGQGGAVIIDTDIQLKRWKKVLWNAAWGGLATVARQPVKVMLSDENLDTTADSVRKIMLEILTVIRACGYDEEQYPTKNVDDVFNLTYSQAPRQLQGKQATNLRDDFKPSLLVDLEAMRPMELSPIVGNVIRKAHQHNIDVPRLETIFAALRPALLQAVEKAG